MSKVTGGELSANGTSQGDDLKSPNQIERTQLHDLNKKLAGLLDGETVDMSVMESEVMMMKKVLRDEIDATKNKIMRGDLELQKDLQASEEENDRLQIELKKYRELYEMDKKSREDMRREIAELRTAVEDKDEYRAELFTLKQELQRLREALNNSELDKKGLREEINAIEKIHEQQLLLFKFKDIAIKDIRQNYEVNVERMNNELHKKDQEITKLQANLRTYSEKERSWEKWDSDKKVLEAQVKQLRMRLSERDELDTSIGVSFEPELKYYEKLLDKVSNRTSSPERRRPPAPEPAPKPAAPKPAVNATTNGPVEPKVNGRICTDLEKAHETTPTHEQVFIEQKTRTVFKEKVHGNVKITGANKDCVTLQNMGSKEENLEGLILSCEVSGREQGKFMFRQQFKLPKQSPLKVWSKGKRPRTPSINDIESDVKYWAEGDNVTIRLKNTKGEDKAILTTVKEDIMDG